MCLTTHAFVTFLNLIGANLVTTEPNRITVHADAADVHWLAVGDAWCTIAPSREQPARFDPSQG